MALQEESQPQDDAIDVETKTIIGKNFSVERYYMLSEIEQQALLPVYLNDYDDCPDNETMTVATVASDIENYQCVIPPFVVLYLLWNCEVGGGSNTANTTNTANTNTAEEIAESFRTGPLERALQKLQSLAEKVDNSKETDDDDNDNGGKEGDEVEVEKTTTTTTSKGGSSSRKLLPNVYVVVDALIWSDSDNDNGDNDDNDHDDNNHDNNENDDKIEREERFRKHLAIVEALAQRILLPLGKDERANSNNNNSVVRLSGATVGLADHPRAAPGLESCLDAIMVGGRDRRRQQQLQHQQTNSNDDNYTIEKSCVGIVCHSLQDLVGYDEETETDAVQGVLQSLTHASFAATNTAAAADTKTTTSETKTSGPSPSSPILGYAHNAHRHWRVHKAGLPPEPTLEETKAYEKLYGGGGSSNNNTWILAVLMILLAFWWNREV